MQVIISPSIKTVPVLASAFKGRLPKKAASAIYTAFGAATAEKVVAEALLQQERGTMYATARIGDAIVSTDNSKTLVSRVAEEILETRMDVDSLSDAVALLKAIFSGHVITNEGGKSIRLGATGMITCSKAMPFTAEQLSSSVPVLYTLNTNFGTKLAMVI